MNTAFLIVGGIALLLILFGIALPTYNERLTRKRDRQLRDLEEARQARVDSAILASLPKYRSQPTSRFMKEHQATVQPMRRQR